MLAQHSLLQLIALEVYGLAGLCGDLGHRLCHMVVVEHLLHLGFRHDTIGQLGLAGGEEKEEKKKTHPPAPPL